MTCTIYPGATQGSIYALASAFVPSLAAPPPAIAANSSLSPLGPVVGRALTFSFTVSVAASGTLELSTGLSGGPRFALAVAAASVDRLELNCASTYVAAGAALGCALVPLRAGVPVFLRAEDFVLVVQPAVDGGVLAVANDVAFARNFSLVFSAGNVSQPVNVSATLALALGGAAAVEATLRLIVTAAPDATNLTCVDAFVILAARTRCTLVPLRGGVAVYALATAFSLQVASASTGRLLLPLVPGSGASPSAVFSFGFQADDAVTGPNAISSGLAGSPWSLVVVGAQCACPLEPVSCLF